MPAPPTPAKRTVRVDMDALRLWNTTIHETKLASLRKAERIEFDYCVGVSGVPPEAHEWMAGIWCRDDNFGMNVPLRVLTFEEKNHA